MSMLSRRSVLKGILGGAAAGGAVAGGEVVEGKGPFDKATVDEYKVVPKQEWKVIISCSLRLTVDDHQDVALFFERFFRLDDSSVAQLFDAKRQRNGYSIHNVHFDGIGLVEMHAPLSCEVWVSSIEGASLIVSSLAELKASAIALQDRGFRIAGGWNQERLHALLAHRRQESEQ